MKHSTNPPGNHSLQTSPELTLITLPPDVLPRVALPAGHKLLWTLKAEFPAPHGTVYVRYSAPADGDDQLVVLTPVGKPLQRLSDTGLEKDAPKKLQALWLAPREQKGLLLQLDAYRLAFPEGFAGLCSLSRIDPEPPFAWNGLRFVEAAQRVLPDADELAPPLLLPQSKHGELLRFAAAIFGGQRYFLRWTVTGPRKYLEIATTSGKTVALHRLNDGFAAARDTSLSALWLDEKRHRGPVLVVRDSDTVRVHVFTDGLSKLLCAQDFNDSSTSIYATTVEFVRDKRGQLIVRESYSEREGGGHTTDYTWTGRTFRKSRLSG